METGRGWRRWGGDGVTSLSSEGMEMGMEGIRRRGGEGTKGWVATGLEEPQGPAGAAGARGAATPPGTPLWAPPGVGKPRRRLGQAPPAAPRAVARGSLPPGAAWLLAARAGSWHGSGTRLGVARAVDG